MKKIIALALVVLAGIGFYKLSSKDQQQVLDTGQTAASAVGKLIKAGYEVVVENAKSLTPDSTEAQLAKAQKDLEEAKAKAKKDGKEDSSKEVVELEKQIDRLKAAVTVKSLQKQLDEKVDDAKKAKENAEHTVDQVKDGLAKTDAAYKSLQEKLDDAKKAYDDLSKKF